MVRRNIRLPGWQGTAEAPDEGRAPQPGRRGLPAAVLALSFWLVCTWLLNVTAYADVNAFFPATRDLATWAGTLATVAWIPVAMHRPAVLASRRFLAATTAAMPLASVAMRVGIAAASPLAATVFACLYSVAGAPVSVYIGLAFVSACGDAPSPGNRLKPLVLAFLLQYLWMGLLWFAPVQVKAAAHIALPVASLLLSRPLLAGVIPAIARAGAPADLEVANPFSFLPITHRLFAVIALFSAAGGFAITYGWVGELPLPFIYSALPVAVLAVLVAAGAVSKADTLYGAAYLLVLAGLILAAPAQAVGAAQTAVSALSRAGNQVFSLVVWYMVVSMGARNIPGAVPLMLVRSAASCLGLAAGTLLGNAVNAAAAAAPQASSMLLAGFAIFFAAAAFFLMRWFSFDATAAEVQPVPIPAPGGQAPPDAPGQAGALERRCAELAGRFGLTGRESEVLGFLARGRNVAHIQDELTLSRNTVKSYVANVYRKLGVHSHQELLDLVEGRGADGSKAPGGAR